MSRLITGAAIIVVLLSMWWLLITSLEIAINRVLEALF